MRRYDNEFAKNRIKLLSLNPRCSMCGNNNATEIHHKLALVCGGSNSIENLIPLCQKCHKEIHKKTKSAETKIGQSASMIDECQPLFSKLEFYLALSEQDCIDIETVFEILETLPVRGYDYLEKDIRAKANWFCKDIKIPDDVMALWGCGNE